MRGWGSWVGRHARVVVGVWFVAVTLAFLAATGVVGEGLFPRLHASDIEAPGENLIGRDLLRGTTREQGLGGSYTLLVAGIDPAAPRVAAAARTAVTELLAIPGVERAANPYVVPGGLDSAGAQAMFADRSQYSGGFATIVLLKQGLSRSSEDETHDRIDAVFDELVRASGAHDSQRGSIRALVDRIVEQIKIDGQRGEGIALPLSFLVMIVVFGGFVAAGIPVVGAVAAIAGALGCLLGFSHLLDLDATVVNVVTVLGLGLCIDYGLLLVSRFREEYAASRPPGIAPEVGPAGENTREDAIRAIGLAVDRAGRTVLFSGLIVAISLSGLLVFDVPFIRALAAAGVSIVVVALLVALTLIPALCVLGARRILRTRRTEVTGDSGVFAQLATRVHARPWVVIAVLGAALVTIALPALDLRLTSSGAALLPTGTPERVFVERTQAHYPGIAGAELTLVTKAPVAQVRAWTAGRQIPGVTRIGSVVARPGGVVTVAMYTGDGGSGPASRAAAHSLRTDRAPFPNWITGQASGIADYQDAIRARAPAAIALVGLTTMALLFLMTGSIVIPIKALLMNLLSLGATVGVVVWVFQHGHLQGLLGFSSVGAVESTLPLLLAAFGFGLSMDYEVFLLARIVELHEQGLSTTEAVTLGLQRSGRIITSAALLMVIVFGGFASAQLLVMKQMGFGLALAIALDATIVRMLLVPATMYVLGQANWWAPAPMRRLHRRWGITG